MAHCKRLCRLSSRQKGRHHRFNYSTDKAYRKAVVRRRMEKAGRKANRGK